MTSEVQAQLQAAYERRFAGAAGYRRRVWAVLVRDFFQAMIPADGAVLDLGCGWGEFVNQVAARRKFAIDMNASSREHLDGEVVFFHQDCSRRWPLGDGALDAVFTSNFFEHLPDKVAVRATLDEAFRCLKPGGRIICLGPNIKHLPGAYWDFWDHFLPITELSLKEVLELAGFAVERCWGRFLPYTMSSGIQWPPWVVSAYLKLPWLWRWRGRQFLVVAIRPGP